MKYGQLPRVAESSWQRTRRSGKGQASEKKLLRDKVTDEEIARIVSRWTGIPVSKLVEGEREKLLQVAEHPA